MRTVYQICVFHTQRDFFDYLAPEGMVLVKGARVWVPFRQQQRLGIVLDYKVEKETPRTLKCIHEVLDSHSLIRPEILRLCQWMSRYYQSPLSEVLPLALPKSYRLGKAVTLPLMDFYTLAKSYEQVKSLVAKQAHKQHELIDFLEKQNKAVSKEELREQGFSTTTLLKLVALGLVTLSQSVRLPRLAPAHLSAALSLNLEQEQALVVISAHLHHYQCFLLQGVTGSGKTEVYLQVIAKVLAQQKQVLVLVPEIGLTPQLLARFHVRFAEAMAVIHSNLNDTERQQAWQLAAEGHVRLIIGTRTAVLTPLPELGLIILDEEHDASFKQMEGVRYSARDSALMRAYWAKIPIILGTATPSLESALNGQNKKYTLLRLQQKALNQTPLHYQVVDLRTQFLQQGLAPATLDRIKAHLKRQNQVLVFINRRGFAPVLLCHQCGWMADCKACDSHLTLHKHLAQLLCHHCGLNQALPKFCGHCKSQDMVAVGAGTQRIEAFLSEHFPQSKVLRIDRDVVSRKNALAEHLARIHQGDADLIIGTQMLAKGHHFPNLSLVVILDADAGFYNPDFRALEHLGQLITQVAGRAGRDKVAGQVLIQTHLPHHPLLNLLIQQGYDAFSQALLAMRKEAQLPPFHYLALLRAQGKTSALLLQFLQAVKSYLQQESLELLGPAPAPMPRKANQYRMQLWVKSSSRQQLQQALMRLRQHILTHKLGQGVRWNIDVDPLDLS